ncbi:MATE family efflux transporter [Cuneatibacter sp. NSJ-177]|jgi:putative MATE family efflux protein|uniref:MATE family efflux transporter n=1 Tax=Cuneatibacter sp. NSJ-177 TaxID=2931401 RepID=UPI001FD225AA|nr:MATE family efflux transporter [Cuneatibacter sp. NSJ-177]MCJ7835183.1 MATE family efflux transporter [Cuneatibacter sp. NSJ-177]
MLFSKKQIYQLMIPLMVEQLLTITVGIADSMMVSVAGEAAVSGVSLVDALNNLILSILTALATGGAVVSSQYIGRKDESSACQAANQLLFATVILAVGVSLLMLAGNERLLRLIFGKTEELVMSQAVTYFMIIVLTYPFMAIYNSAAALFRSMGNSKISMQVSLVMNLINIGGNAILIFGLKWGVAGAAIATLFSRIVGSLFLLVRIHNPIYPVHVSNLHRLRPQGKMIRRILSIGIPGGLENGMFQLGKILVLSLVSSYGTASIMANSVSSNLSMFMIIPGNAVSLALITVVGQCIGAGEVKQARAYTRKLITASTVMMGLVSTFIIVLRPFLLGIYNMSDAAYEMSWQLLMWHAVVGTLLWPLSFNLPNTLRAGNDAAFTMGISMFSMWVFRVGCSYLLGRYFQLYGVWIAMFIDWGVRVILFMIRYRGEKWHSKALI